MIKVSFFWFWLEKYTDNFLDAIYTDDTGVEFLTREKPYVERVMRHRDVTLCPIGALGTLPILPVPGGKRRVGSFC